MPVANVPNVRRLADSLAEIGIQRVVVVTGTHAGSVKHALVGAKARILYVPQPADAGSAGALLAGSALVEEKSFLVVYADTVTTTTNLKAIKAAGEGGADGAVLYDRVAPEEGSSWYRALLKDGKLQGIVGHDAGETDRLCGVFALNRTVLPHLEANPGLMRRVPVGGMPPLEADLAQSLNDWIARDGAQVAAIEAQDFVVDLDKPWHIVEANQRMAHYLADTLTENSIHPTARIHDGAELNGFVVAGENVTIGNRVVAKGNLFVGANSRIINGAIMQGSGLIGEDCRVSDYCILERGTVIGNNCVVGHGAEMDGTAFDGAYLYHYCEISGLVGCSVDIGAATVCGTLRFDDGPAEHRIKGRRERPRHFANETYFGDYSRTGVNVITMPGVKIGAYACVGAGIVVYEDVPSRTLRLLKQETVDRPWGPERYGW